VNNHDKWGQIVLEGRKHIEAEYDVKSTGISLGDIYKAIIGEDTYCSGE